MESRREALMPDSATATQREVRVSTEAPDGGTGVKVMVIDDSQTIRRTAETLLTKEGYTEIPPTEEGVRRLIRELVVDHTLG